MRENPDGVFEELLRKYLKKSLKTALVGTECPDENAVSAYIEDRLTPSLRNDFERHASLCARCQNELSFLSKAERPEAATPDMVTKENFEEGWLRMIQHGFAWLSELRLKPVLAVLTVTLISGYVGLELFQRESHRREPSLEVAQSLPQNHNQPDEEHRPSDTLEREKGALQNKVATGDVVNEKVKADEQRYFLTAKRETFKKVLDADKQIAVQDNAASKRPDQPDSLRDAFSPVPAERFEGDKGLRAAKDSLTTEQAAAGLSPSAPAPPPPSSEAAQQKADAGKAPKSLLHNERANVAPANEPALTRRQRAADEENTISAAKEASREKPKVHTLSVGAMVSSRKLKQEASPRPAPEGSEELADQKLAQLRVGGKTFELRDSVWKDLAIVENEEHAEVIIYKNSSEYKERIKPLSAFQAVLSKNEDCQIEFQGKVYYVKGPRR